MAIVSSFYVVVQRLLGCARSCHIDEGLEDITVRPYPEQELAGSSSACRLQANLPEHVLAAPTRLDRAEAPPRPRTHVGQAGTGSNPSTEPSGAAARTSGSSWPEAQESTAPLWHMALGWRISPRHTEQQQHATNTHSTTRTRVRANSEAGPTLRETATLKPVRPSRCERHRREMVTHGNGQ